jgi:type I restriction enzyme, S subunit
MISLVQPRDRLGFAIRGAALETRVDVNYARMAPVVADLLAHARFPMAPLGKLITQPLLGTSTRSVVEEVGTPVLRIPNVHDGDWDLAELRYTTLTEKQQEPLFVKEDDILMVRSNGSKDLVGRCAVFHEEGSWIFASFLMRLRVKDRKKYLPEFLARFLNSQVGRVQIDQLSRQALLSNINRDEIGKLLVPNPQIQVCRSRSSRSSTATGDSGKSAWPRPASC